MNTFNLSNDGSIQTNLKGKNLLAQPYLNKGLAFTKQERKDLGLEGILPPTVLTLEEQVKRAYLQFKGQPNNLRKNV